MFFVGRWQTTLKLATKREYVTQWCYYSLFKFTGRFYKNMQFTKEDAKRIVLNCAKRYEQKLLNKKLLIVYRERQDNQIYYIEVIFLERNYLHLTGLEPIDKDGKVVEGKAVNFYRKCRDNKLAVDEFQFKEDGTTHLKLSALPTLMDITKITKISGGYNNVRPYLYVDKVIGGVNFCLGLSKTDELYVPSSALLENIKNLTDAPSQVLAIFEKNCDDVDVYRTVKHVAKGLNLNNLNLPDKIKNMISLQDYVFKGNTE